MNKPVAHFYPEGEGCTVYDIQFAWKVTGTTEPIPLYTHPAKYCPSENNEAYEKGFIDGMAKMTESAVHRAVEGMSAKTLTDEEIFKLAEMLEIKMNHALYAFARTLITNAQENLDCYDKLSDASKMVSKPISEKSRAILRKAQDEQH
jgi:hypothetical protein